MKKRILQQVDMWSYTLIGFTENSYSLYYLHIFLSSLFLEDLKKGPRLYNLGQSNDLMIDYGEDSGEDFYVALWNLRDSRDYEIDRNIYIDDTKIEKLKLSYKNFDYIFKQWESILNNMPKYVILSQDGSDWVELLGKNELSQDDVKLVESYKQYQKN